MNYTLIWWMLIYCKFQKTQTNSVHQSLVCFLSPMLLCSTSIWGQVAGIFEKYTSQKPFLISNEALSVGVVCWGWGGIWNENKYSLSASSFCQLGVSNRRERHRTSSSVLASTPWNFLAVPPPRLIYFLSLWFCHIWEHHINKII